MIAFFKLRPDVISADNVQSSILTVSMMDSPVGALFHAVDKVSESPYLSLAIEQRWFKIHVCNGRGKVERKL